MKKFLILITALAYFAIHGLNAQVFKTVQVDTAGTLYALLSPWERDSITNLTLTGSINSEDFNTMKNLMPSLTGINLELVHTPGDSIPAGAFNPGINSLILPSSITLLGDHSVQGCGLLASIVIPSRVTSIGYLAFASCIGLTSVTLPESVRSIGIYAFAGCSSLPSIHLPDSVTSIGKQAFVACSLMKSITIPNRVTSLVDYAFAGCSSLDSIIIGTSVTSIGMYAFVSCSNLRYVSIPVSDTSIGSYAFAGCNSLGSVTIPSSVTSIAAYAFVSCPGLTSVIIQSSFKTTIGEYAFVGDAGLESVTIYPSMGTSIGRYAFISCSGLKTFNMLSPSVTSIGEGCFIGTSIDTLVFPTSLTSVGMRAFLNCDSLKSVTFLPSSGASIGEYAFADCSNLVSVRMLSPSVDSIREGCFNECINLTKLDMPSSLKYIGRNAFYHCNITGSLTMPPSLTYIGQSAFMNCPGIDTLTFLPAENVSIGSSAFAGCSGLKSLEMYSPSVNSIGDHSFNSCQSLNSIIFPSSLNSIEMFAFDQCSGLKSIRINKLIPPVIPAYKSAFGFSPRSSINLYVPAGTKEAYQAAETWSGFNIIEFDLQMSTSEDTLAISDTTGSTALFDITSSTNWQIYSDQTWLTADPVMGMDTASIRLITEANPDTVTREAILTVTGENVPSQTVVVTQAPRPGLSVSSGTLGIGPLEGSMVRFNIVSNQDWTSQSDKAWLKVSSASGHKNAEITLTAEANPDTTAREAIVTVYAGRLTPKTIVVTQAPRPTLSVSSSILVIGSQEGSNALFNITSNSSWTIQSDQAWLAANPSSGNGNFEITLTAEANPDAAIREAIATVSVDGLPSQTVIITQQVARPTGIIEAAQEMIVVYPNPVQDVLYVNGAAGKELILYDIKGLVVFSRSLCNDHETIDLSTLPFGNYIIQIGNMTMKIVK
jgi:hypothetical protein